LAPVIREGYAITLPRGGGWREAINSDATIYGGSGVGNAGWVHADELGRATVTLPPLSIVWLVAP
jgi:1,4-alpha-glucan branching enzyme